MAHLSADEVVDMMEAYRGGESAITLARRFGIATQTFHTLRRRLGEPPQRKRATVQVATAADLEVARARLSKNGTKRRKGKK